MRILLIFLALISAPAAAQVDTPVSVRIEYVYSIARLTCYRLQKVDTERVQSIVFNLRNKFRLSDDELNLYLNFCMIYDQGYQRKELRD